MKGQMVENVGYINDQGDNAQITGGKSADLSGPIRLCSRSDNNVTRHFGGRVAYLGKAPIAHSLMMEQLRLPPALEKGTKPICDVCSAGFPLVEVV